MSFTWLNNQGVKSSAGFVFQRADRFCYHYVEGHRVLIAKTDGGAIETIYLGAEPRWEPPYETEPINDADIERITANIVKAMAFMRIGLLAVKRRSTV
jgi:hypothetical protein